MQPVRVNGADRATELQNSQALPLKETLVGKWEQTTDMATASRKDATQVPNWVFPILASILFVLVGFVYTTIENQMASTKAELQRELTDVKNEASTNSLLIHNMREQLIAHGWSIDDDGKVHPPQGRR